MRRYSRAKLYGKDSLWELHLQGSCKAKCSYCKKTDKGVFSELKYHPNRIKYSKPETFHTYEPDWILQRGTKTIYIEAKGRFVDMPEANKYIHIRDSLASSEELVFLFMRGATPMPGASKRKDGTRRSHSEWATKNDFRWYDESNIGVLLR